MYFVKKRLIGKFIGVATAVFLVVSMMPGLAWGAETNPGDVVSSGTDTGLSLPQDGLTPSVSAGTNEITETTETTEATGTESDTGTVTVEGLSQSATTSSVTMLHSASTSPSDESTVEQDPTPITLNSFNQQVREKVQLNNLPPDDPIKKEVSTDGENFATSANIGPGGTIYYRLIFEGQTGELTGVDKRITDILPDGFKYITGSAKLKTATSETAPGEFEPDSAGLESTPQKLEWKGKTIPAPSGEPLQNAAIIYEVRAEPSTPLSNPYENFVEETHFATTDSASVTVLDDDLVVDKKVSFDDESYEDSVTVGPGNIVFFKIEVEHRGSQSYSNLSISDVLPPGFTYQTGSATLTVDGTGVTLGTPTIKDNVVVWSSLALDPEETATLVFQAKAGMEKGTFENRGSVWKSEIDEEDEDKTFVTKWASDTAEVSVGPSLTKTVDKETVKQGEKVSYKIIIDNPAGQPRLTGVRIVDLLPAGFAYVNGSTVITDGRGNQTKDSDTTDTDPATDGQKLTWPKDGGSLPAVESGKTLILAYDVSGTVISGKAEENTAVFSATSEGATAPDTFGTDTAKVTVLLKGVKKEVSADGTDGSYKKDGVSVTVSGTVYYKITLTNADPNNDVYLVVRDKLPANFTYLNGSTKVDGVAADNPAPDGELKWSPIKAVKGKDTVLTFQAKASPAIGENNINTVTVKDNLDRIELGSDTANVKVTGTPTLSITKSVDKSSASPNDTLTYTITYQNTGNTQLTNVVITDGIPTGTTYVAASATANGTFNQAANALTWTVGSLNASASGSVSFKATVNADATGTVTNKATIKSDQTAEQTSPEAKTTVVVVLATTQQPATLPGETGSQVATQAAQLPTTLPKTGLDLLGYLFGAAMLVSSGLFLRRLGRDKR